MERAEVVGFSSSSSVHSLLPVFSYVQHFRRVSTDPAACFRTIRVLYSRILQVDPNHPSLSRLSAMLDGRPVHGSGLRPRTAKPCSRLHFPRHPCWKFASFNRIVTQFNGRMRVRTRDNPLYECMTVGLGYRLADIPVATILADTA